MRYTNRHFTYLLTYSWERRERPSGVLAVNAFSALFSVTERFRCKENAILLFNMVTDKVDYAEIVLKIFEVSISGVDSVNPLRPSPKLPSL